MADIRLVPPDEFDSQIKQLVEIVARIRDLPGLVPKPSNDLEDALHVSNILRLRVGIVEPKVAFTLVMSCIAEIHEDCFRVADVQITVWLWWKTSPHLSFRSVKMRFAEMWMDLWVPSRFVQISQETFFKDAAPWCYRCGCGLSFGFACCGGSSLRRCLRGVFRYETIHDREEERTFAAASNLGPNFSWKALSTAFFRSKGLAQRRPGVAFIRFIVAPSADQPTTAAALIFSRT